MEASDSNPQSWHEWRRLRAVHLKQQGWHQRDIAAALGVREETVSRWLARARQGGHQALRGRTAPGRPPKLTSDQKRMIPEFLWHGPEAYGFRGEAWTCARVAQVLKEELGVSYSKTQVSRILKGLAWTPQVPITRPVQRDEAAIERWRAEAWPELLRRAQRERRPPVFPEEGGVLLLPWAQRERRAPVFVDEAGFYLLPAVVRTYSPRGQTPLIPEWQTRDHLSVM